MDLRSQRGKEMYRDEYNFLYTLNGKNNKKLSYRRETARQLRMFTYIGWLTDRAMHRTAQNHRGCTISDIQTL